MIGNLFNGKNKEDDTINRQMDFAREQQTFSTGADANSDMVHIQQQKEKVDLLKWQQDLDEETKKFCLGWLGYYLTDEGYKQLGKPKCNEMFIQQVIEPTIVSFNSKAFINSNLDKKTLLMRQKKTANSIATIMVHSSFKYGIKFEDFDSIMNDIKTIIVGAGNRAVNGWTKKTDSTTFKRIESAHDMDDKNNKKRWGLF